MRKSIIRNIHDALGEYSLTVCEEDSSGQYIESQITECSLFSDTKLVILRSLPSFGATTTTDNKKLLELFKNIPEGCFIVIDGVPKSARPSLYKKVETFGKVVDFPQYLSRDKALQWTADRFTENLKEIGRKDLELIVDSIGEEDYRKSGIDVDKLYVCVKKICDYLGKTSKVTYEDILKSADKYNRFFVMTLFDAFDNRDLKKCISIIEMAKKSGDLTDITTQTLFMFLWRFKMLWFVKESLAAGKREDEIIKDMQENVFKLVKSPESEAGEASVYEIDKDASGKNKPEYNYNALKGAISGFYGHAPAAQKYSREEIFKILHCVNECLIRTRYDINDLELTLLLDSLMLTAIPSSLSQGDLDAMREIPDVT